MVGSKIYKNMSYYKNPSVLQRRNKISFPTLPILFLQYTILQYKITYKNKVP